MEESVAAILEGVDAVPVLGTPGSIVVFGESAFPVLSNRRHEVLIAAAIHGSGRLVVFSHNAYVNRTLYTEVQKPPGDKRLYQNIAKWVMDDCFTKNTPVIYVEEIDTKSDIPTDSLVIWNTAIAPDGVTLERLLDFVHNGGGMVAGTCPWGFLQLNPEFTLETIPVNIFIQKLGMCFTHEYYSSNEKVSVSENSADWTHLLKALKGMDNMESFSQKCETIKTNLNWLPDDYFCQVREQVNNAIDLFSKQLNYCPVPCKPVTSPEEKALVTVICRALQSYDAKDCRLCKIPSVETFPGDLTAEHSLKDHIEVFVEVPSHDMRCFHPTGYYVPAGCTLTIHLHEKPGEDDKGWTVAVGSHTDELFATDEPWRRWPTAQVTKALRNEESNVRAPCGGLVYFISEKTTRAALTATIANVIQAPFYDVSNPELKKTWLKRRKSPGLWTDLVGHRIMLSVPASSVRELDEPEGLLEFWDSVVECHISLAAEDLNDNRRREWVVADEQPVAGYMHSGYPIVTHLDVANPSFESITDAGLLNCKGLYAKGSWGMFHELGHNMQDPMWTFEGTGEVTCNIFTLHAMDMLCGQKPWIHQWLKDNILNAEEYLKAGAQFELWQGNPGVALFVYAQLARDFGWEAYKAVFRQYRELKGSKRPHDLQQQIDQWITCFSKVAGQNLLPLFEFWGFPVSDSMHCSDLSQLPLYRLTDEFVHVVPVRAAQVMAKYSETC